MRPPEDEETLFDTEDFKAYVAQITELLAVKRHWPDERLKGWSVPELHRALGGFARPRWTLLALEWADGVQEDVGAVVRYRL